MTDATRLADSNAENSTDQTDDSATALRRVPALAESVQANQTKGEDRMKDPDNKDKTLTELAERALKNYEQAIRMGLKVQEEAAKLCVNALNQTASIQDWQKRFSNIASFPEGLIPAAQKRYEETLGLMEKNSKAVADLAKRAFEAAQTASVPESQAKWADFWTSSLSSARSNLEAMSEMSSKTIDTYVEHIRKSSDPVEAKSAKA